MWTYTLEHIKTLQKLLLGVDSCAASCGGSSIALLELELVEHAFKLGDIIARVPYQQSEPAVQLIRQLYA